MSSSKMMHAPLSVRKVAASATLSPRMPVGAGNLAYVNDDAEELRQRRLDAHMRSVMSPGRNSGSSHGGFSGFSNAQITDHYTDCIKLSSENKINARNAFGLHLIDYMLEMLLQRGELGNFQVAGCTLDAGAKIYASRVDMIYAEAYKILGGMGVNEAEVENDSSDQQTVSSVKEKPKPKQSEATSTTIEKNVKNLNMTSQTTYSSELFEDDREEGFMLWQLHTREDNSLIVDMLCPYHHIPLNGVISTPSSDALHDIIPDLCKAVNSCEICETLNSTNENHVSDCLPRVSPDMEIPPSPLPLPDYSMLPCPPQLNDMNNDGDDDDVQDEVLPDVNTVNFFEEADNETVLGTCGNTDLTVLHPQVVGLQSDEVHVVNSIIPSDYSYFTTTALSSWAGLHHWKIKPVITSVIPREIKRPQRSRSNRIDFTTDIDNKLFQEQGSLTRPPDWVGESYGLPADVHLELHCLFQLFMQCKWKVEKQSAIQTEEEYYEEDDVLDSIVDPIYDANDPSSLNISVAEDFSQLTNVEDGNISHYELLSEPKKVETVNIHYSRKAKKVDAKALKLEMWSIISSQESVQDGIDFSLLYSQLLTRVVNRSDISIPIYFVFLLHLANEKGLTLFPSSNSSSGIKVSCNTELHR